MKCPQHYLTDMQEVILFYNGLDVPTRQILDSKGVILTKTATEAKVAFQEMAEYSQKWHNRTSSKTKDGPHSSYSKITSQQQLERRTKASNLQRIPPGVQGRSHFTYFCNEVTRFYARAMAGVEVDTLTMEQYLALSIENQAPGVVKPEIGGNINFEIKSQFMHELREDTFSRNEDEDAHDHIDRVLSIVGLFNIPGVSKDAVML
ncbi:hypothetical protein Tco_0164833 [Tanacetum coccineum]